MGFEMVSLKFGKYCALETTGRLKIEWNILRLYGGEKTVPGKNQLSQCFELFLTKPDRLHRNYSRSSLRPHYNRCSFRKHCQYCCSDTQKEIFPISGCTLDSFGDCEEVKKSGPCWKANSIDISEWEAEHVFFFWRGECKCFKVPQVILFSLSTLSSVRHTSSQIREQTLATPPPQTAVEAWRPTHWTTREVPQVTLTGSIPTLLSSFFTTSLSSV